jgi:hypothetical protein
MADEAPKTVTIRNEATGEERQVRETAAPFFVNDDWYALDAIGRRKALQPTTVPALPDTSTPTEAPTGQIISEEN